MQRIVIHRDHTFEFDGRTYRATFHGQGWGWSIDTEAFDPVATPDFATLAELRAYVNECSDQGWPLEEPEGGPFDSPIRSSDTPRSEEQA